MLVGQFCPPGYGYGYGSRDPIEGNAFLQRSSVLPLVRSDVSCSKIFFAINFGNIKFFITRLPTVAGPRLPSSLLSVASSSIGKDYSSSYSSSSYSSLSKNEQGRCLNSAIDIFWAAESPTDAGRVQNNREQQGPEDAADLFPTDRKCGVCLFATRKRSELTWWVYLKKKKLLMIILVNFAKIYSLLLFLLPTEMVLHFCGH